MKIGAHVSAAGGLFNAPKNAAALGLECFQFFSRSPQGGKVKDLSEEDISLFKDACEAGGFSEYYIHAPYIINLASSEARIRYGSIEILRSELARGTKLGARALMMHPGSAKGTSGKEQAIAEVAKCITKIMDGYEGTTQFLIEISAGAGEVIGDTFEEVRAILDAVDDKRIGVCFDTAHAFASGYDLRNATAVKDTMDRFTKIIGNDRLLISHCNDSKVELGARKDRHEHIGAGFIGREGFEAIMKNPVFADVNLILETEPEGQASDFAILREIRG